VNEAEGANGKSSANRRAGLSRTGVSRGEWRKAPAGIWKGALDERGCTRRVRGGASGAWCCLSGWADGEVGQVVDAQASGGLSQARAAGGEESAQEVALAQFLEPGPPVFGA
jgi:hypothetical protein